MNGARRAVSFLTPFGGAVQPGPDAVMWFPMVGAVLGLGLGLIWWLADGAWSALLVAAIVVVADLAATGLLHADGLVDTADGLLPHLSTERRLEVMSGPDIGAFGVWVAVAVFALRWGAIASMRPAPFLIAGLWCASRTAMAYTLGHVPYARANSGGLAAAFGPGGNEPVLVLGVPAALLLAAGWRPLIGPLAVLAALGAAAAVVALARRRVGGFTGDVLGASALVGETVGLVVAAGRW